MYAWSKRHFTSTGQGAGSGFADDPLSPEGEIQLYRKHRNQRVIREAETLAHKCATYFSSAEDSYYFDSMDAMMKGE